MGRRVITTRRRLIVRAPRIWEPLKDGATATEPKSSGTHTMDSITNDFGEVLLWSFWFFIWITALMVWFRCLFDLFGDRSLSGWG